MWQYTDAILGASSRPTRRLLLWYNLAVARRISGLRSSTPSPAERSVREEWLAGLPEDKQRAFQRVVTQIEASYAMFSIAVNESFSLRRSGALIRAREQVGTTASVMHRFTDQLSHLLETLMEQARLSNHWPRVAPLNPAFFRWPIVRRLASWEGALDLVVPTRSLRYRRKLSVLLRTVNHLAGEFHHAAREISEGSSVHPESHWEALDALHYDLNTCLRETIVVLKSFLLGLSPDSMDAFCAHLEGKNVAKAGDGADLSHRSA